MIFNSVEAAFQAAKTTDRTARLSFCGDISPSKAKRMGRNLTLREDWEDIKSQVMLDCLRSKFAAGSMLAAALKNTGKEFLVEGNFWHDNIWGDCKCAYCSNIKGQNLLGKLLMQVRDELNVADSK